MRSRAGRLGAGGFAALALALSACATQPAPRAPASVPPPAPHGSPPSEPVTPSPAVVVAPKGAPSPESAGLARLPGWGAEDHAAALAAFQAGCGVAVAPALKATCVRARALGHADDAGARRFFEQGFRAEPVPGEGVLTAYFAPAYEARSAPDTAFSAPVRPRPADLFVVDLGALDPAMAGRRLSSRLAGGVLTPYPDRSVIETVAPAEPPLAWMRPEDLFFLQIQGSGVLYLPDGRRLKAAYAGDNGRPFVAIARPMVEAGVLTRDGASGEAIRAWLAAHRGVEAEAMMRKNPRYVFFSLAPDDGAEPPGAAGVPLTPGRSIAVDPARHAYGELYWIDACAPVLTGAPARYRRLVVALDTGAAIRGEVRADLYTGRGEAAGREAGRVRHTLTLTRLVPVEASASDPARPVKRTLRPDEVRLWAKVARTAEPSPGRTAPAPPLEQPRVPPLQSASAPARTKPPVNLDQLRLFAERGPGRLTGAPALHGGSALDLDPRRRRRLVRERDLIEGRIDLHGLDQDRARSVLERFILSAHGEGARAVLVITGKGLATGGVIRRFAPEWLRSPPLRAVVAGVAEADRRHGGAGALYVALKAKR